MSSALPNGQLLLLDMPESHEGADLLLSKEQQRELYPLTTVEKNQERLEGILALIAADTPIRTICKSYRVGWHTLQRIREAHGTKIATLKQSIARRMALFVQLGIEQLIDDVTHGRIEPDRLGVVVGIITDKMQVLTGEASVIVGSASDGPKRFSIDALRERLQRPTIDVTPTGSDGGEKGQTREGAPALPAAGAPQDQGGSDSTSECER